MENSMQIVSHVNLVLPPPPPILHYLIHSRAISNCLGLPFSRAQLVECNVEAIKARRGQEVSSFGVRLTAKLAPLGTGKWFAYIPSVMMKEPIMLQTV